MGWASRYIELLRSGQAVSFRPRGQSMTGRIESGQLCTVAISEKWIPDALRSQSRLFFGRGFLGILRFSDC